MSGLFGGGADIPKSQSAGNLQRTATPLDQPSEQDRKNRRLRASSITAGFAPVQLGQPGLLGVN